jgi:hypothetical protein
MEFADTVHLPDERRLLNASIPTSELGQILASVGEASNQRIHAHNAQMVGIPFGNGVEMSIQSLKD